MNIETISVDGVSIFVPDFSSYHDIHENMVYNGYAFRQVGKMANVESFLKKYPEFIYGFQPFSSEVALPIFLLKNKDILQRVHIERLTCEHCNWYGKTATSVEANYPWGILAREKVEQLKKDAFAIPIVPCPKCGGELPKRHTIWTEPYPLPE